MSDGAAEPVGADEAGASDGALPLNWCSADIRGKRVGALAEREAPLTAHPECWADKEGGEMERLFHGGPRDDYYDVAQICQNGHVVNSSAKGDPGDNRDFCERCGAKTVTTCEDCKTDIRGFHHISGVIHSRYDRPAFCFKCGAAFPWTATGLQAAHALADTLEGLSPEDRDELKRSLDDLVKDTPRTRVAETRFKQVMKRSGKEAVEGMRSVLTDIISETVRKTIFGA